ncbi:MAG: hypothetical protein ABJN42_29760 [Roseibium sp.]|uniref:hypothetical protein n=1 Tax=Roseibium sp. TaxID=1936156 RepID=UPI003299A4FD
MTFEQTDAPKELLQDHDKMSIFVDPDNPLFLNVIAFDKREGFSGVTVIAEDGENLELLIQAMDQGILPEDGSITIVHAGLIDRWVEGAMADPAEEAVDECPYREFIRAEIPDATYQMFSDMPWLARRDEVLNHFCTGQTDLRRESAYALPIMTRHFIGHKGMESAIDGGKRSATIEAATDTFNIPARDMKKMVRVENMASQALAAGEDLKQIENLTGKFDGGSLARKFSILNSNQFPRDLINADAASDYVNRVGQLAYSMKTGFTPYIRAMRQVGAEDWVDARGKLPYTPPQEEQDYLKRVDMAITSAMFVGQVRASAPGLMEVVNKTAEAIWNDEVVEPEDAAALSEFLELAKMFDRYESSSMILEVIGDNLSLKDIREFSTRWHHVQQTMDNDVLTTKSDLSWDPILGEIPLGGGIIAREMISSGDLKAQGDAEKHCVGGYSSNILSIDKNAATIIFSIEQPGEAGKSNILSTIEFKGRHERANRRMNTPEEVRWNQQEHKAKRNAEPSHTAQRAADRLIEKLRDIPVSDFKSYLSSIRSNTTSIRDVLSKTSLKMKANITNPDIAETSLSVHAEVLPKKLRNLDWEGWLEKVAKKEAEKDKRSSMSVPTSVIIAAVGEKVQQIEMKINEAKMSRNVTEPEM